MNVIRPSKIIGPVDNPYMFRWNIIKVGKLPRIYVHRFMRSDDDRALHDHPWWFISILLRGSYIEHTTQGVIYRRAPSIAYRNITHRHRIELTDSKPITLFITGPVTRMWGFWCEETLTTFGTSGRHINYRSDHFVPWRQFDGCDE